MYAKYPGRDMAIILNSTKPSLITFGPDQSYLTFLGTMAFNVIFDEKRLVNCFTLNTVSKPNVLYNNLDIKWTIHDSYQRGIRKRRHRWVLFTQFCLIVLV